MDAAGNILSREEITALLHGAAASASESVVAPFDFSSDEHQVRAVLPALDAVARHFARRLQHTLSVAMRQSVRVGARPALCHGSAAAAVASLGSVTTACLTSADPAGVLWLAVETSWVDRMVDACYGGAGETGPGSDPAASLAARWALHRFLGWTRADLLAAWPAAHPLVLDTAELPFASPPSSEGQASEKGVLQPFSLQMAAHEAEFALVFPLSLLARMAAPEAPRSGSQQNGWQQSLGCALREAPVLLSARLAEVQLTMGELLALRNGDILPIEEPDRVAVYLEDRVLMSGELGMAGGRKVIRLKRRIEQLDPMGEGAA